jgi:beta-glucosidase
VSAGQSPSNYNRKPSGHGFYHRPGSKEKPGRDYVFSSPEALFPFGFGLSYTDFAFSHLKLNNTEFSSSDTLRLEVDVENIGALKGKEVIQVYINDLISSVTTPIKELRGFRKIELDSGEMKTVSIEIPVNTLSLINADMQELVEAGEFEVMVGNSSENILLRETILVN